METTKKSIWNRFGSFVSRVWHSITDFFKPDNIEDVPVSSLSTYLRNHLKFIENIISHYKPGQRGGISFDEPMQQPEAEAKEEKNTHSKAKTKVQENNTSSKTTTKPQGGTKIQKTATEEEITSKNKNVEKQAQTSNSYGDLNKFTDILKKGSSERNDSSAPEITDDNTQER